MIPTQTMKISSKLTIQTRISTDEDCYSATLLAKRANLIPTKKWSQNPCQKKVKWCILNVMQFICTAFISRFVLDLTKIPYYNSKANVKSKISSFDVRMKVKSFVSSLSTMIPISEAHPEAKIYRTSFKNKKDELCKILYKLFNEKVFDGKLPVELPIEWSNSMTRTAGFCYNRTNKNPGGVHKSSKIKLAMKVWLKRICTVKINKILQLFQSLVVNRYKVLWLNNIKLCFRSLTIPKEHEILWFMKCVMLRHGWSTMFTINMVHFGKAGIL